MLMVKTISGSNSDGSQDAAGFMGGGFNGWMWRGRITTKENMGEDHLHTVSLCVCISIQLREMAK